MIRIGKLPNTALAASVPHSVASAFDARARKPKPTVHLSFEVRITFAKINSL